MTNIKKNLFTLLLAIALVLCSVFIYENFIRKDGIDVNEEKLEQLKDKVKAYETEIVGYRTEMFQRKKQLDSLESVKGVLVHKNDSLQKQVDKYKSKRNETLRNLNNVSVDELYKLFSNYQPTRDN